MWEMSPTTFGELTCEGLIALRFLRNSGQIDAVYLHPPPTAADLAQATGQLVATGHRLNEFRPRTTYAELVNSNGSGVVICAGRLGWPMWTKATEFSGNVVWLKSALARSIVRLAYETPNGYDAKTVIVFDLAEQWTVIEKPEVLLAFAAGQHEKISAIGPEPGTDGEYPSSPPSSDQR